MLPSTTGNAPTLSKKRLGCLILLAVFVGLFVVGRVAMSFEQAAREREKGLISVHRSTFDYLVNKASQTAMVFADGTLALVADDLQSNRRFYLVALETDTTRTIALPKPGQYSLSQLLYAGDAVVAIMYKNGDPDEHVAYRVDSGGTLQTLTFLEYLTHYTDERLTSFSDDLEPLLRDGSLDNLAHLKEGVCVYNPPTDTLRTETPSIVEHFFNAQYFVKTNISTMRTRLARNSGAAVVERCEQRPAMPPGYTLELFRSSESPLYNYDVNTRIVTAIVRHNDTIIKQISFDLHSEWFFYAVPVGTRLYFVGNAVKYIDLATLAAKAQ